MTTDATTHAPLGPIRFRRTKSTLLIAFGVAAGTLFGVLLAGERATTPTDDAPAVNKASYQCPMHPSIVMDHPGECPICGMKLVPTDSAPPHGSPADLATVQIDPGRQQLIGLSTTMVDRGPIGGAWRTTGKVAIDETRVRHVNIKIPGFVEHIHLDFVGRSVKKGEPLFSVYSPELFAAQEELLLAIRTRDRLGGLVTDGDALVSAAYRKLELWDIPRREIDRVVKTGRPLKAITLYSPISGVVTKKDVVQGMKLDAGAMPYEITDLSEVWVLADVYETELRHVRIGMRARLTLEALPNRTLEGRVAFIDPMLDAKARTAKVRISFPNPTGELRPEMFGEVVLLGEAREALRVAADAIIDSGTEKYVFVGLGDGKFQPREVELGETDGERVEVVSGLSEGEAVVSRANFLIDSESRLRASLSALKKTEGHPGH